VLNRSLSCTRTLYIVEALPSYPVCSLYICRGTFLAPSSASLSICQSAGGMLC
jgi:hypothetical protein